MNKTYEGSKLEAELKSEVLECSSCPPKRNCCTGISRDFPMITEYPSAMNAFGKELAEKLRREGKAVVDYNGFHLISFCPLTTEEGLCSVHERKS